VIAEPAPPLTEDPLVEDPTSDGFGVAGQTGQAGLHIAELVHELRTPLQTARLALDLLEDQDQTTATIRSSLSHMHDLLSLASGHAEVLRTCSLRTVVSHAVTVADPARRVVVTDLLELDQQIYLQPAVARQLVVILLDNALKYSAADQPVVLTLDRNEDGVVFDVTDHGSGITPDEAETLFVAGTRGSASSGSQGSGLGLAIARRFARAAGGDVLLVNSSAGSTTFRLMLPVSPISDFVAQAVEIHKF
jgi:signal transduction histidine kinase